MATWATIKAEAQKWLDNVDFETGGTAETYLLTWANRIVRDICRRISIPSHLTSANLSFTTADYYKALPTNFLKLSRRLTMAFVGDVNVPIITISELFTLDPSHADTSTASQPSYCAIQQPNLYVYPMITCTLALQNYYRVPTDMALTTDSPDIPDDVIIQDLIVNGICKNGFRFLREKDLMSESAAEFENYLEQYRLHLQVNQFIRKATPA